VVTASLESARGLSDEKGLRLEAAVLPHTKVLGDPVRLQQVVSNLLNNAVKFTPTGGRVGVRLDRDDARARIVVTDTGRGISPEFLPHVFDRFRQSERTTVHARGGLGLGLAIVRHLVDLQGGTVEAESPGEGRGATFTVMLPLVGSESSAVVNGRWSPRALGNGAPVALGGVRVLVVDDDPDACDLIATVLAATGAEARAVHSAKAALDALEGFDPHLLLSDIGMPVEDGYTLILQVRERESASGAHLPAVALTAFASHADRERALASGFDAYLAKPVSPEDLTVTVADLVGKVG
jgi:CheY-like chemotaxis protein